MCWIVLHSVQAVRGVLLPGSCDIKCAAAIEWNRWARSHARGWVRASEGRGLSVVARWLSIHSRTRDWHGAFSAVFCSVAWPVIVSPGRAVFLREDKT